MGIPDIQQLGEHPDDAQSCEHGAGHFNALRCIGAGFAWFTEGIGNEGGAIIGPLDLASADEPSSSISESLSLSLLSSSSCISACTSAFLPKCNFAV